MVYLKSVENVITFGKLIVLLFLFCLPLLSILYLKTKRNDLARPVMGTIFLVYPVTGICVCVCWPESPPPPSPFRIGERAKRARHSQVCSIEN